MPGLAVLEHVGARSHFDKSTPEFLEDQVFELSSLTGHYAPERFL